MNTPLNLKIQTQIILTTKPLSIAFVSLHKQHEAALCCLVCSSKLESIATVTNDPFKWVVLRVIHHYTDSNASLWQKSI